MNSLEFNAGELKEQRKKLEKELDKIRNPKANVVTELLKNESFSDVMDRATAETDRNLDQRIKDREQKLASKIEKAIARIDSGEYQNCSECGSLIPKSRLQARMVADLCIDCKEKQEQGERIS